MASSGVWGCNGLRTLGSTLRVWDLKLEVVTFCFVVTLLLGLLQTIHNAPQQTTAYLAKRNAKARQLVQNGVDSAQILLALENLIFWIDGKMPWGMRCYDDYPGIIWRSFSFFEAPDMRACSQHPKPYIIPSTLP